MTGTDMDLSVHVKHIFPRPYHPSYSSIKSSHVTVIPISSFTVQLYTLKVPNFIMVVIFILVFFCVPGWSYESTHLCTYHGPRTCRKMCMIVFLPYNHIAVCYRASLRHNYIRLIPSDLEVLLLLSLSQVGVCLPSFDSHLKFSVITDGGSCWSAAFHSIAWR